MSRPTLAAQGREGDGRDLVLVIRQLAGRRVVATYHGGPYIDLSFGLGHPPFDCLNVWDYQHGRPTIACTPAAVDVRFLEWADACGPHLAEDLANYAMSVR